MEIGTDLWVEARGLAGEKNLPECMEMMVLAGCSYLRVSPRSVRKTIC